MKKKFDKPLIWLGVTGLIAGAVVYYCLGTKIFCLATVFWILLCYLWQHTKMDVAWWKKLISVFTEACFWVLSAIVCYLLSWCVDYIFGWQTPFLELHFVKGAILYIIGWQVYKIGLVYRWWIDFRHFVFYAVSLLGTLMGGMLILRNMF